MSDVEIDNDTLPLWRILENNHILEDDVLREVYDVHLDTGKSFYRLLVSGGFIQEAELLKLIADELGSHIVDLKTFNASQELLDLVPQGVARMYNIIPYEVVDGRLGIVAADALNYKIHDELQYVLNYEIYILVSKPENVKIAVDHYYPVLTEGVGELLDGLEEIDSFDEEEVTLDQLNDTSIVKFVDAVLKKAVKDKASDVHFEPFQDEYKIRCRIDGALYEVEGPPKALANAISSRVKVLSNMNISERRIPQDGRIDYRYKGRAVDMRVSTLPTQYGESICIRVLDRENTSLALDTLGFSEAIRNQIDRLIKRPNGIFIVTGPTGSGKSTTLYSCLNELNTLDTKILTAEDPVEYDIEGIMQVGIKENIGLTYARVLRSFLRQDPDKIMVGEIRDGETANIAIQAALTGHTVFTTLHTNDAPGAVARLLDMDVKPFLLAASLISVLGQRLLRRICSECRTSYKPGKRDLEVLELTGEDVKDKAFYYGKGCAKCNSTGYKGRIALHEMFEISPTIKALISKGAPSSTLKAQALKEGMFTMRMHGIQEILAGTTTVEEVIKYT
ncbi:MAG: GspE/PulE family protein [Lentisphaeraceae bacterium]|nr:GspE/PulE family protein [Lentisphaeraceae bacterium]